MTYVDTVLTIGTVLLVLPVVAILLTYTVRGTPNKGLGHEVDPADETASMLDDLEADLIEEDCHACR